MFLSFQMFMSIKQRCSRASLMNSTTPAGLTGRCVLQITNSILDNCSSDSNLICCTRCYTHIVQWGETNEKSTFASWSSFGNISYSCLPCYLMECSAESCVKYLHTKSFKVGLRTIICDLSYQPEL